MQVHIILGIGKLRGDLPPSNLSGVMADVAASPNDPVFISHHAMVDCIFEEWLKRNPDATYPDGVSTNGHQGSDFIVPFFPIFQHNDMFKVADNFGYSCDLDSSSPMLKPL